MTIVLAPLYLHNCCICPLLTKILNETLMIHTLLTIYMYNYMYMYMYVTSGMIVAMLNVLLFTGLSYFMCRLYWMVRRLLKMNFKSVHPSAHQPADTKG